MKKISAIIFDLGGVLLDLNQDLTLRAFARLGMNLDEMDRHSSVFRDFETGRTNADHFRQTLQSLSKKTLSAEVIDHAWNAMLLDMPAERFSMLESLRKNFRVYLLSNTNSIHVDCLHAYMEKEHNITNWRGLFDKVYYSHEIGRRKPNKDVYEYVLADTGCKAGECLFIDDSKPNLHGAEQLGICTMWATKPLCPDMYKSIMNHCTPA